MSKSKVISKNKLSKNNTKSKHNITSSREKIIMAEKKSIIINKFKKNILKIAALFIVFLIIIFIVISNKKVDINANSNISKLDADKYSVEIINLYNGTNQLDKFTVEMNRVQNLIGTYLISNSTLKENSFSELVKTLNSEINKDKWVKLSSEKSIYYNGKYTIDNNGNLKFKFESKKIEPNWINNESIARYITLN